ncbi:MAG: MATE family efflux transporter [Cyanobacteria bacterium P01_F01_bin.86]
MSTQNLLRFSLLSTLVMSLYASFLIVDIYFISALGVESLAGTALIFPFLILLFSIVGGGIGIAASKLVSQRIGSQQYHALSEIAFSTILLSLAIASVYIISFLLFANQLLGVVNVSTAARIAASDFATPIFLGSPIIATSLTISSLLQAEKDVSTPVKMLFSGGLVNILLDKVLIFGVGFIPSLGVTGAALATIIGFFISSLIGFHKITSRRSLFKINLSKFKVSFSICRNIIRSGIPIIATVFVNNAVIFCITIMLASLGTQVVAAYGLLARLEYIITVAMTGIGNSVITLGGIELGARRFTGFAGVTKKSGLLAISIVVAIALILFFKPHLWITLFSSDTSVHTFGNQYLNIVALTYPFYALGLVYNYAYQALNLGYFSLLLALIRGLLIAIPGTFAVIYLGFAAAYIPIAIAVSFVIHGLISYLMFKPCLGRVQNR